MDKICIVKLRKKMIEGRGMGEVHDRKGITEMEKDAAGRAVSLMLTPEQMRVLQSNPNLLAFLSGVAAQGSAAAKQMDETIVFKFTFEPVPPVRLLKMGEVVQMLRISRGYLRKIIRQGELKSYKIGRLRRIMFDDILSYLEDSQEFTSVRQRVSQTTISQSRVV